MLRPLAFLAALVLATGLPAQNNSGPSSRQLSFIGYSAVVAPFWIQASADDPPVKVEVPSLERSRPIRYAGPDALRLLRISDQPDPRTGVKGFVPVGSINLAGAGGSILVVAADLDDGKMAGAAFPFEPPKAGTITVYNVTQQNAAIRVPGAEFEIKAGRSDVRPATMEADALPVEIVTFRRGKWMPAYQGSRPFAKHQAMFVLISQAQFTEDSAARVRFFVEDAVPPPPPPRPRR